MTVNDRKPRSGPTVSAAKEAARRAGATSRMALVAALVFVLIVVAFSG